MLEGFGEKIMEEQKSLDQELADAVVLKRELASALDRMVNHSCGWTADDFRRAAKAAISKMKGRNNG
jgi:hypothetical protein